MENPACFNDIWARACRLDLYDNQTGSMVAIVLQMHGLEKANRAETHQIFREVVCLS